MSKVESHQQLYRYLRFHTYSMQPRAKVEDLYKRPFMTIFYRAFEFTNNNNKSVVL